MARPSWLVDSNRIATKIRSASGISDPEKVKWNSNPSRACPNCQHIIDNSDVAQEWPGLPRGVKFDPSDQEIIWHLLAKVISEGSLKSHPFIDEFIVTVNEDDGICCAHPQNLPGVKQDGSVAHFFHRSIKAYNTGTRKRRKIHGDDSGDVRWHKTGRTKPVILDGVQRGCKKIMVLYMSMARGEKAEKTNWVMHQYHLGVEDDEKDGEYVISKVFFQQQQVKQGDKIEQDFPEGADAMIMTVDPVTPKLVMPEPPRLEMQHPDSHLLQKDSPAVMEMQHPDSHLVQKDPLAVMEMQHPDSHLVQKDSLAVTVPCAQEMNIIEDDIQPAIENPDPQDVLREEVEHVPGHMEENTDDHVGEDPKWWDSESQYLLDSQQLVEGLSLCDDLLQSQSPNRDGDPNNCESKGNPRLSDYTQLGPENFKKDLEACQNLVIDPANIELDTPPDFRLSQLEFCSQESFIAWGGNNVAD